ncbi:MAG: hypothetical protein V7603_1500 [Micromonosporaceae bacterium]
MGGAAYFVRRDVAFGCDVLAVLAALRAQAASDPARAAFDPPSMPRPTPVTLDRYYLTGAETTVTSTNHETIMHYMAKTADEASNSGGPTAGNRAAATLINERGGCS